MKAIVQRGYGGVDVLAFPDVDRPRIRPDEVLIRVRAAGVDQERRGSPAARHADLTPRRPRPR
jgi:hypothetical protein